MGLGRQRWPWARFAGPAVTLAIWVIVLSGAAWLKITIQQIAPFVWVITAVLAWPGLYFDLS